MRRRFGLHIPQTIKDACDPATMALIVYDMQVGVLGQLPDAAETIQRVSEVLTAARGGGYPVFYTRHPSRSAFAADSRSRAQARCPHSLTISRLTTGAGHERAAATGRPGAGAP